MCRQVTPLAGVWIEIMVSAAFLAWVVVTPLAGVWIEITTSVYCDDCTTVTPLAGVWIEISVIRYVKRGRKCHSPCGSVD